MDRWSAAIVVLAVPLILSACGSGGSPEDGGRIYARHCASCHGETGTGDGPTARLTGITPANLQEAVREKSKAELLGTMARGQQDMPAFGQILSDTEREAVYQYLRTLPEQKAPTASRGLDPTGAQGRR